MARHGMRVRGVDAPEENLLRARFIGEAMVIDNIVYRLARVKTLDADRRRRVDLTLFPGVLYHVQALFDQTGEFDARVRETGTTRIARYPSPKALRFDEPDSAAWNKFLRPMAPANSTRVERALSMPPGNRAAGATFYARARRQRACFRDNAESGIIP
jgi:hypothetical protein